MNITHSFLKIGKNLQKKESSNVGISFGFWKLQCVSGPGVMHVLGVGMSVSVCLCAYLDICLWAHFCMCMTFRSGSFISVWSVCCALMPKCILFFIQVLLTDTNTQFVEQTIAIMKNLLDNHTEGSSEHLGQASIETMMLNLVR